MTETSTVTTPPTFTFPSEFVRTAELTAPSNHVLLNLIKNVSTMNEFDNVREIIAASIDRAKRFKAMIDSTNRQKDLNDPDKETEVLEYYEQQETGFTSLRDMWNGYYLQLRAGDFVLPSGW